MKKNYVTMQLLVIDFDLQDVVTASVDTYVAWDSAKLGSFGSNNFS